MEFSQLVQIGLDAAFCAVSALAVRAAVTGTNENENQSSLRRRRFPAARVLCSVMFAVASMARWRAGSVATHQYSDAFRLLGAISVGFIATLSVKSASNSETHLIPINKAVIVLCAAELVSIFVSSPRILISVLMAK